MTSTACSSVVYAEDRSRAGGRHRIWGHGLLLVLILLGCDTINPVAPPRVPAHNLAWVQTNGPFDIMPTGLVTLSDGRILVSSYEMGMYESSDNGSSWTRGFPQIEHPVKLYRAGASIVVIVSNGLYESVNEGAVWSFLSFPQSPAYSLRTFDRIDQSTALIGSEEGVFITTDGGVHWTLHTEGLDSLFGRPAFTQVLDLLPVADTLIVAATNKGIARSSDHGLTWRRTDFTHDFVYSLFQSSDGTIFAGAYQHLYRSDDEGQTWDSLAMELPRIIGETPVGRLYLRDINALRYSDDHGKSWVTVPAMMPQPPWAMAVAPNGTFFAITMNSFPTYSGGVYRSTDEGLTWSETENGIDASDVSTIGVVGNVLLARADKTYRSTDLGSSWTPVDLPNQYITLFQNFAESGDGTVYAAAQGLYRSTDGGVLWLPVLSADGKGTVTSVAATKSGIVYFGTDANVFRSLDGGGTWEDMTFFNFVTPVHKIAVNESGIVFISDNWTSFAVSSDSGATWTHLTPGFSSTSIGVNASGHLFAGDNDGVMHRSTDGGSTWETIPVSDEYGDNILSILVTPDQNLYIVGYDSGIFRSTDNGDTWERVSDGLLVKNVWDIAMTENGFLYAGTRGGGVFRTAYPVE